MTTVGERIISEKHYNPELRNMFLKYCEGSDGSIVDAGTQVLYTQNRLKRKPIDGDQIARLMGRYAARCGVESASAMRRYFNPKGVILVRLPQEVRDLWGWTVIGELNHRGGFS